MEVVTHSRGLLLGEWQGKSQGKRGRGHREHVRGLNPELSGDVAGGGNDSNEGGEHVLHGVWKGGERVKRSKHRQRESSEPGKRTRRRPTVSYRCGFTRRVTAPVTSPAVSPFENRPSAIRMHTNRRRIQRYFRRAWSRPRRLRRRPAHPDILIPTDIRLRHAGVAMRTPESRSCPKRGLHHTPAAAASSARRTPRRQ